jgi:hypothetical protein
MVEVAVNPGRPMTVRADGRRELTMTTAPASPSSTRRPTPSPSDEARYPRASAALAAVSVYVATAFSSLSLLPLTLRKTLSYLPAPPRPPPPFSGARATLSESALRFAMTAVLPAPFSALAAHIGAVPLQAAALRAQAGGALRAARGVRGLRAAWAAHVLRDLPFTCVEAYALSALVLSGIEAAARPAKINSLEAVNRTQDPESAARTLKRQGGIDARDAVLAGGFAGLATVPLDFLRTRLLVAARPSVSRTVRATVRLARRQGAAMFLAGAVGTGPRLYLAECMVRPIAFLTIYTATRAFLVSSWLTWKTRTETVEEILHSEQAQE